jgi:hypothetical protein
MKPLEQLTNIERAKLLHELFKSEIPALLQYAKTMAGTVRERKEELRAAWNDLLFSFDFWLSLANDIEERLRKYGRSLETSRFVFSEQLFDGYNAFFMVHCLDQYAKTQETKSGKFPDAVELFFM